MLEDDFPKTMVEFDERFATERTCQQYLMRVRWPDGWRCPQCGHDKAWLTCRHHFHCARCDHQSSLTAGTVFHGTHKPLRLWFKAIFLMTTQKNGLSAKALQRHLGVSYATAWTWLHKLRAVMGRYGQVALHKTVEVDETYLGSDKSRRPGRHKGNKALVLIAVEDRGPTMGRARLVSLPGLDGPTVVGAIQANVATGSTVHSDGLAGYGGLADKGYAHRVDCISRGKTRAARAAIASAAFPHVHRLASLLQRWMLGTHQGAVRDKHLQAYLNEFVFRFNRRRARHRTLLFQRLCQQGVKHKAQPYWRIVGREAPDRPLHLAAA